jgi:small-conductance mechanosensitive channel
VLATPAPEIIVHELSANSVSMLIRAWVATADVAGTRSDLLELIKSSLGDGGFKTPYARMHLERHAQAAK